MVNRIVLNETSYFGDNARENLASEIQKRNFKKVFFKIIKLKAPIPKNRGYHLLLQVSFYTIITITT